MVRAAVCATASSKNAPYRNAETAHTWQAVQPGAAEIWLILRATVSVCYVFGCMFFHMARVLALRPTDYAVTSRERSASGVFYTTSLPPSFANEAKSRFTARSSMLWKVMTTMRPPSRKMLPRGREPLLDDAELVIDRHAQSLEGACRRMQAAAAIGRRHRVFNYFDKLNGACQLAHLRGALLSPWRCGAHNVPRRSRRVRRRAPFRSTC